MKEYLKLLLINIKSWLWAVLANAWEDYLKEYLKEELHVIVSETAQFLINFRDSEEYEAKRDEVLTNLFAKIKLPFFLKPFRVAIRNILTSSIQKKVDEKLGKISKLIEE